MSNSIILFLRSFDLSKSDINENSVPETCFLKLEILNFSSTNKTRLEFFLLVNLFL